MKEKLKSWTQSHWSDTDENYETEVRPQRSGVTENKYYQIKNINYFFRQIYFWNEPQAVWKGTSN